MSAQEKLDRDTFLELYLHPFEIDGTSLDDVSSLHSLYKEKILACQSLDEMDAVRSKFKFLVLGGPTSVHTLGRSAEELKMFFDKDAPKVDTMTSDLANFILPIVMLHAWLVSKKLGLPEYPAAVQYVASSIETKEEHVDERRT